MMTMSVNSLRRTPGSRLSRRADEDTGRASLTQETEGSLLPVPVSPPRTIRSDSARVAGYSAIDAQVIGERRGLRAGANVHGLAAGSYNRTEWSGSYDRRAPKGRATRTEI
jgi:hypothetical protein